MSVEKLTRLDGDDEFFEAHGYPFKTYNETRRIVSGVGCRHGSD
jgi:hypothetical protein